MSARYDNQDDVSCIVEDQTGYNSIFLVERRRDGAKTQVYFENGSWRNSLLDKYQAIRIKLHLADYQGKPAVIVELKDINKEIESMVFEKRLLQMTRETKHQDKLYQTVSHEMRTPLNGIK